MHRLLITILGLLLTASNLFAAGSFPGLLGMNLVDAQKTDFFNWFHLRETDREKDTMGRTVVSFKPEGGTFQKLVTVKAVLAGPSRIVQLDLFLSRAFLNDRNQRESANDIAKSVLLDAVGPADRTAVKILTDEINSNRGSDMRLLTAHPQSETPLKESPGYLTYLGKRYMYTQELSATTLKIANVKQDDEDWLDIQIAVKK